MLADEFIITLRAKPSSIPSIVRLRKGLKYLGRVCGLECVLISGANPEIGNRGELKMLIGSAFPSKYLRACDVGDNLVVTISRVKMEDPSGKNGDEKPVLYFQECTSGLVLNKTNANMIEESHGGETDRWTGKSQPRVSSKGS